MIDTILLKTGKDIEKEMNRIILIASAYQVSHIKANKELNELFNYGKETGKFSKAEIEDYMRRKNCHGNGRPRTHLEFAFNLSGGQREEHKVFLYLIEWLKKGKTEEIKWELYGSDLKGYVMIVNNKNNVIEPDYKLSIGEKSCLVESKSFYDVPKFKIANLKKYKERGAYIIMKYDGRYYFCSVLSISYMLKQKIIKWAEQDAVEINQKCIDKLIEKKVIREIRIC